MVQHPLVGQGLLKITFIDTYTLGKTPLEEWSARRSYLYLKTYHTHKRQVTMPPAGFEPTILDRQRLQISP